MPSLFASPVDLGSGESDGLLASVYRTIFEQSPDASLVYVGTRMVTCNEAAVHIFRARDRADLLARHPSELAPETQPGGRSSAEMVAANNLAMQAEGLIRIDWLARRLDGTTFPAQVTLTAVDLGGERGTLTIVHDLTEQVRQEEALRDARNRALASAQARSEFLASMSHEIRTPMNAVIGFAELLETMEQDATKRDFIQTIARAGKQLLGLINDILDLSKLEAGKVTLDPQPLDLRQALEEIASLLAPRAAMKGVDLVFRWAPGTPEGVMADGLRLRQIVTNLLGNAIKFTPHGTVLLDVTAEDGSFSIVVEDTGIGVSADKLDRIFGRYEQAEAGTATHYGGSGLGLSIVRQLTELMGGEVTVTSTVGVGSRFRVRVPLPVAPDAAPAPLPVPVGGRGVAVLVGMPGCQAATIEEWLAADGFVVQRVEECPPLEALDGVALLVAGWDAAGRGQCPPPGHPVRAVAVAREHVEEASRRVGDAFDLIMPVPLQRSAWTQLLRAVDARR